MENAVDALHMAAGVLIFVLALTISINAFGEVRVVSSDILKYNDREYTEQYIPSDGNTTRKVSVESIVPNIYKAYAENNKIIFSKNIIGEDGLYKVREGTQENPIYIFDLNQGTNINLTNRTVAMEFIKGILYGKDAVEENIENILKDNRIYLNEEGIYDKIKDREVTEKIGLYYESVENEDAIFDIENVDVTKIKRVISYE